MSQGENTDAPRASSFPPESDEFSALSLRVIKELSPDVDCSSYFHYTSAAGLQGIVESNTLHFSDTKFVNDQSERMWGLDVFEEVRNSLSPSMDDRARTFLNNMFAAEMRMSEDFRRVIFCMSLEGNLLNQWRDYGKDVVPYCIEFDSDFLETDQVASFDAKVTQIEYDHITQKVMVGELCSQIFKIMEKYWDKMSEHELERMAVRASFQVGHMLQEFKHPAFAAEKEARLSVSHFTLQRTEQPPSFRPGPLGLVPYYVWAPSKKLAIKSVMVGPSPHSGASVEALRLFLKHHKIDAEATVSGIPLRR